MAGLRYSLYWKYTIREVRRRPLRSLLTLVGIVLGVAAVTAVALGTEVTHDNYAGIFKSLVGRADLEVLPPAGQGVMPADIAAFDTIPGVQIAVPIIQTPASLLSGGRPVPLLVLGIDPARDAAVRDYTLIAGDDLSDADGVLLEVHFAARHGCALGQTARLMTTRGPVDLPIVGLLAQRGPARFNGGAIAFVRLQKAQALFATAGQVSAVQLVLERSGSRSDPPTEEVRQAVQRRFPGREVHRPGQNMQLAGEFLNSIEQALSSLSAIAVVAGALVILNTFLMNTGERRRQLALYRALGATRRQVAGLLIRQALLLGGLGTLIGLPVGILLASLLVQVNEYFLDISLPRVPLSPGPLLKAAVLGPLMTLAATLVPIRQAATRPPLEGITLRGGLTPMTGSVWPVGLGGVLLTGVLLFEIGIVQGWIPPAIGSRLLHIVVAACLIGCACLIPPFVPMLLRIASLVVPPLLGVEGRLAVRQLLRQRARTALTVGVLFAAVTASISFGTSYLNNLRDIRLWYQRTVDADFIVRAVQVDPAVIVTPADLPLGTTRAVRRLPGVATVDRFRFVPTRLGELSALVMARDFSGTELPLVLHTGTPAEVKARLHAGEAVLGSPLAQRLGVSVGDDIHLPTREGSRVVRVAAIAKDYTVGGMVLYLDWQYGADWLGFDRPHGLAIIASSGAKEQLAAALSDYAGEHGLLLEHNTDFMATIQRAIDGVLGLVAGLVGLIFLVAAVGVVNTLTTNVLDQTRELGVLRAVGMQRGQIHKLVLSQAIVLALISCLAGAPAGVLLAYLMNRATPGLLGHFVPFHIVGWLIVVCVAGVMLLAAFAALLPARRAARLTVIEALRYE